MLRSLLADRQGYAWRDCQCHVAWTRLHIPCHSLLHPCYLRSPTHNPQKLSPQNNNLPVLPPLPVPSELTREENSLHFLPPLRTCSKLPLSCTCIWDTSSYPHGRSLHFLSNLCTKTYTSRSQHIFSGKNLLFPQLRRFNDQNYSSKPRARHSPLRELKLVMSDLTPRKRKLYHRNAEKCTVSLVERTSTLCAWH